MRGRLVGLVFLAIAAGFGWFFIWLPLEEARAGAVEISLGVKAFLLVPMAAVVGMMLVIGGNKVLEAIDGPPETVGEKWLAAIVLIVAVVAGGLGYWWFNAQLDALGYS